MKTRRQFEELRTTTSGREQITDDNVSDSSSNFVLKTKLEEIYRKCCIIKNRRLTKDVSAIIAACGIAIIIITIIGTLVRNIVS